MNPFARSFVLTAALCAAGCTSGLLQSHAPPSQLYVLRAVPGQSAAVNAVGSLRVQRPLPAPGLDSDRLALSRSGNRLDYYANSRWGASLPDVVENLSVNVLRQTGAWVTVTDARASINADYRLLLYIDHFEAVYPPGSDPASADARPTATVGLHGMLIRRTDGAVVASLSGTGTRQAEANRMGEVVAAFQLAANAAMAQVASQAATAR